MTPKYLIKFYLPKSTFLLVTASNEPSYIKMGQLVRAEVSNITVTVNFTFAWVDLYKLKVDEAWQVSRTW
jgi:hypothetical protein